MWKIKTLFLYIENTLFNNMKIEGKILLGGWVFPMLSAMETQVGTGPVLLLELPFTEEQKQCW